MTQDQDIQLLRTSLKARVSSLERLPAPLSTMEALALDSARHALEASSSSQKRS